MEGHPVLTLRLFICPQSFLSSMDSTFPALLLPAITVRASSPLFSATPVVGTAMLGNPGPAATTRKTHGLNSVLRHPPQQHLLQKNERKDDIISLEGCPKTCCDLQHEAQEHTGTAAPVSSGCAKGCILRGAGQEQSH